MSVGATRADVWVRGLLVWMTGTLRCWWQHGRLLIVQQQPVSVPVACVWCGSGW
jgi:hypothetical protein